MRFLKIVNTEPRKTVGYCFPKSSHKTLYSITEYDIFLWHGLVEFVTVYGKDDFRFTMKDGTEIIFDKKQKTSSRLF